MKKSTIYLFSTLLFITSCVANKKVAKQNASNEYEFRMYDARIGSFADTTAKSKKTIDNPYRTK